MGARRCLDASRRISPHLGGAGSRRSPSANASPAVTDSRPRYNALWPARSVKNAYSRACVSPRTPDGMRHGSHRQHTSALVAMRHSRTAFARSASRRGDHDAGLAIMRRSIDTAHARIAAGRLADRIAALRVRCVRAARSGGRAAWSPRGARGSRRGFAAVPWPGTRAPYMSLAAARASILALTAPAGRPPVRSAGASCGVAHR